MFYKVTNKKMLEECFEIRKEVFVKEQNVPAEHEIDEYEENAIHVIGYDNNDHPIATARIRLLNETTGKVERVAILKSHRGQGLGLKLLKFVEQTSIENTLTFLTMNAQYYAVPFYEKLGYKVLGEPFDEENIKHIIMEKHL